MCLIMWLEINQVFLHVHLLYVYIMSLSHPHVHMLKNWTYVTV